MHARKQVLCMPRAPTAQLRKQAWPPARLTAASLCSKSSLPPPFDGVPHCAVPCRAAPSPARQAALSPVEFMATSTSAMPHAPPLTLSMSVMEARALDLLHRAAQVRACVCTHDLAAACTAEHVQHALFAPPMCG